MSGNQIDVYQTIPQLITFLTASNTISMRLLSFIYLLAACHLAQSSLVPSSFPQVLQATGSKTTTQPPTLSQSVTTSHELKSGYETVSSSLGCKDIYLRPTALRCAHVREVCDTEEFNVGLINYLSLYFCFLPAAAVMLIAFTALCVCFASLGKTAADFLSPNLYTISKLLKLSDHLAGLTLLALGNSAADIFGTYKALSIGSAELAISELLGATLFVLTVVIGSICLVHPFEVPLFYYSRDNFSYLAVLIVIEYSLEKNSFDTPKAILLIGLYVTYVIVAVWNYSWLGVANRKKVTTERIRSTFAQTTNSQLTGENGSTADIFLPGIESLEDITDEERRILDELEGYFLSHPGEELEMPVPVQTGSYGLKVLLKELSYHTSRVQNNRTLPNEEDLHGDELNRRTTMSENEHSTRNDRVNASEDESMYSDRNSENESMDLPLFKRRMLREVFNMLLPRWNLNDTIWFKSLFILTYPANVVLSFTTPVRQEALTHAKSAVRGSNAFTLPASSHEINDVNEHYDIRLDLMAFKVQFTLGFSTLSLMHMKTYSMALIYMPIIFICASTISILCLPTRCPQFEHQMSFFKAWNYLGSALGFILSIQWISVFATEVIAILKQVALILGISDEILGVTVFAMGNSVGDLIANSTIALMGMPLMAFAACFGGPLLSLCSMGVSSLMVMSNSETPTIDVYHSTTLRLNVIVIFCVLVFMNIYFSVVSRYVADRTLGIILISIWILTVSACAIIELR